MAGGHGGVPAPGGPRCGGAGLGAVTGPAVSPGLAGDTEGAAAAGVTRGQMAPPVRCRSGLCHPMRHGAVLSRSLPGCAVLCRAVAAGRRRTRGTEWMPAVRARPAPQRPASPPAVTPLVTSWDVWGPSRPPDRRFQQGWSGQASAEPPGTPSAGLAPPGRGRGRPGPCPLQQPGWQPAGTGDGLAPCPAGGLAVPWIRAPQGTLCCRPGAPVARHGTARRGGMTRYGTVQPGITRCGTARRGVACPIPAAAPRPCPSRWAPAASPAAPRPGGRELTRDPPRYKFCIVRGWGELGGSQGRL